MWFALINRHCAKIFFRWRRNTWSVTFSKISNWKAWFSILSRQHTERLFFLIDDAANSTAIIAGKISGKRDSRENFRLPHVHPSFSPFLFFSPFTPSWADNEAIQDLRACERFPSNQLHCEFEGAIISRHAARRKQIADYWHELPLRVMHCVSR